MPAFIHPFVSILFFVIIFALRQNHEAGPAGQLKKSINAKDFRRQKRKPMPVLCRTRHALLRYEITVYILLYF